MHQSINNQSKKFMRKRFIIKWL